MILAIHYIICMSHCFLNPLRTDIQAQPLRYSAIKILQYWYWLILSQLFAHQATEQWSDHQVLQFISLPYLNDCLPLQFIGHGGRPSVPNVPTV